MGCTCERCKAMCERGPCVGTPGETRALVRAGMGNRLALYEPYVGDSFVAPAPAGREGERGLRHTNLGRCTFFVDGLCEVHTMKPQEGREAMHGIPPGPHRVEVMRSWRGKRAESVWKLRSD